MNADDLVTDTIDTPPLRLALPYRAIHAENNYYYLKHGTMLTNIDIRLYSGHFIEIIRKTFHILLSKVYIHNLRKNVS